MGFLFKEQQNLYDIHPSDRHVARALIESNCGTRTPGYAFETVMLTIIKYIHNIQIRHHENIYIAKTKSSVLFSHIGNFGGTAKTETQTKTDRCSKNYFQSFSDVIVIHFQCLCWVFRTFALHSNGNFNVVLAIKMNWRQLLLFGGRIWNSQQSNPSWHRWNISFNWHVTDGKWGSHSCASWIFVNKQMIKYIERKFHATNKADDTYAWILDYTTPQ